VVKIENAVRRQRHDDDPEVGAHSRKGSERKESKKTSFRTECCAAADDREELVIGCNYDEHHGIERAVPVKPCQSAEQAGARPQQNANHICPDCFPEP
jgi:hypothetical protein